MNETFRLLLICAVLALSASTASAQLSYDGYEALYYEIYFEHAGERDGEFKLLFQATDDRGRHFREWIRPDSYFLGFQVSLVQRDGVQTAFFRHPDFPYHDHVHVPLSAQRHLSTACGTFGLTGRGETATAYVGDSFELGDTTATVRGVSPVAAVVQLSSSTTPTTIPLSPTGALRSEHYLLQREVYRLQREQWRADGFRELSLLIAGASIFLLGAYLVIYGCIFIGWFTRDRHLDGSNPNDRNG